MDLNKLLRPKRVAIVGASEKENLGGFAVRMMKDHGADRYDDVFLVNPGRDQIFGKKCYHSLSEMPHDIDLVIIATAKRTVEDLLREAHGKGARGAVVFASGYGETGKEEDKETEASLKALCEELDMALMGPNCAGYMNFVDNMLAMGFLTTTRESAGKVGLVSQSGMICTLLLDSDKVNFSYVISCGNSKIVEVVDYIDFLIDDEETKVIASYIEGISDPEKFVRVLEKAAKKKKPIILLKVGRSPEGQISAASHTGSLSGSDKAFDAIFDKYGVIRVDDLEDLAGVSNMFATLDKLPESSAVVSVNGSGGETGVSSDVGYLYEMNYPKFSEETLVELKKALPEYATINNPLDTTATICYDTDIFADSIEIIASDPNFDMLIVGITIVNELTDLCVKHMSEGLVKYKKTHADSKPIIVIPAVESGRMTHYVDMLRNAGIPVMPPTFYAYKHIRILMDYVEWLASSSIRTFDVAIPENLSGEDVALSEHDSKNMLAEFGIPVPEEFIATNENEAVEYADRIGYPIVMKIESADILHKSDAGGVKLNLKSPEDVRRSYGQIMENAKAYKPDAVINGGLIQKMLPQGMEVIIGVNNDPVFGPMVLFGLGGVFVEVFKDVSLYPAPFGLNEAYKMINSLKSSKMFYGYRGQEPKDVDALAETLVLVSQFAVENKNQLVELDINPLFVYEKGRGVAAADGLVVLKK
jgi:acetyltransferase